MIRNAQIYPGKQVGDLRVIQSVRLATTGAINARKRWRVECICGVRFTIPHAYLTRKNPKTHCGCKIKGLPTLYKDIYHIWAMMLRRCSDPTHVSYRHYGGRGIAVCDEWRDPKNGFAAFLAYIGPRPSPSRTIDRVNNDLGYQPYQPNGERQVRWATPSQQRSNQRQK